MFDSNEEFVSQLSDMLQTNDELNKRICVLTAASDRFCTGLVG
jgi:hypothetical protein